MALNIKNEEVDQLARELAATTGESISEAVLVALRERLRRERRRPGVAARLLALADEVGTYPVLDGRNADEILGYDAAGLPS